MAFIFSCNPLKKLTSKEYFVNKNIILDKSSGIDKTLISSYIRQKPNRKLFRLFYFHTWFYNLVDVDKNLKRKEIRNKKYEIINEKRKTKIAKKNIERIEKRYAENEKRIAENKKPLKEKSLLHPKLKDLEKLTIGEKMREIGEAAFVLDTFLTTVSVKQINMFLNSNGFFNAKVRDSIVYEPVFHRTKLSKRANIYYIINAGLPYFVRNVEYVSSDTLIKIFLLKDSMYCKIKSGMRFNSDSLNSERIRICKAQLTNGYYEFTQEFVFFLVDSNFNDHKMDIKIGVKEFAYKVERKGLEDTIMLRNHMQYYLDSISVISDYNQILSAKISDSSLYEKQNVQIYFLSYKKMAFKKSIIANEIIFEHNSLYNHLTSEESYRRLSDLKAFKNINILFAPSKSAANKLNVNIHLTPVLRQSLTAESEGTNTSGNLGISGSLIYQNRNAFRGAELLEIKIKGGVTAQKNFGIQSDPSITSAGLNIFNTYQLGPEFNLYFPRQLFPFTIFHFSKNSAPKTIATSSANYQKRPEFGRTLVNASYGFEWKNTNYLKLNIVLAEINVIKVSQLSTNFQQNLSNSNDFFLKNSFSDHITTVSRFTFFYNNQNKLLKRNLVFIKVNLESSGNILRGLYNLTNQPKDNLGSYRIAGIRFAQFLRADVDYRYYKQFRKSRLVLRTFFGIGDPFLNLGVLPYEKSFFSGGPNSVRAWRARSLGPGGSLPTNATFDKIGDIQLEGNFEYRFPVYKVLNGAFFIDAGNIWLSTADPNKPLGEFKFNRFYKEIAVGSGFGVRADLSFFIIRLDASFKIRDPSRLVNDRWMFNYSPVKATVINLGIGYPF